MPWALMPPRDVTRTAASSGASTESPEASVPQTFWAVARSWFWTESAQITLQLVLFIRSATAASTAATISTRQSPARA